MVEQAPSLLHHFDNKDNGNCAVFAEFRNPPLDPKYDGYDLRGLQCKVFGHVTVCVCGVLCSSRECVAM